MRQNAPEAASSAPADTPHSAVDARRSTATLPLHAIMSRGIHNVPPETTLGEAARKMTELRISSLLVCDNQEAVGILTERDLLREVTDGATVERPVSCCMSKPVLTAPDFTPFVEAWALMQRNGVRHLLVVDTAQQPVGMVSETDFRQHLDARLLHDLGTVESLLDPLLPKVAPTATIAEALAQMRRHFSSYVVVVENDHAVGMLTERDVPALLASTPADALDTDPVTRVAYRPVHIVPASTWLMEAAAAMQRLNVRHLAVTGLDGQLIGMIQQKQLMARIGTQLEHWYWAESEHAGKAQAALARERYQQAAEAAHLGYWDYDVRANRILYSEQLLRLMGAPSQQADQTMGLGNLLSRIHLDQQDDVRSQVERLLSTDPAAELDARYQVKGLDDVWRWVHTRGRVTSRTIDGSPLRASGVTMDIDSQMSHQQALQQARAEIDRRQHMLELLSDSVSRSPVVALVWTMQPGWPVRFVTDNVSQWGHTPAKLLENGFAFESLIHPDDLLRVHSEIEHHLAHQRDQFDLNYRLRAGDGRWLWLEDHTRIQRNPEGVPERAHGLLTDVTATHFDKLVAQLERDVLDALTRGTEVHPLMAQMTDRFEQWLEGSRCSVMLLDETRNNLHVVAGSHLPSDYLAAIDGVTIGPKVGSCGTAAYTGHTVITTHIATDPLWADFKDLALAHGLVACWSVPIKGADQSVLGTFAIYPPDRKVPLPHEIRAVERTAYLAGLAVERSRDQATLHKLKLAVEQSPHSIVITDLESHIEYANQTFYKVTGYTPEETLGANPRMIKSGKTASDTYERMWEALRQGLAWQGEFINRRKDGTEYTESVRISPVIQPNGRVTHYLAIKEDITLRKEAEHQIHRLAYYDTLTGLPNRQLLTDRFTQALSLAKRQNSQLALMFIDLDHFKNINDTLGHPAGDRLLIETTQRLTSALRAEDTLSRQGGDEFVLLLPNCGPLQAAQVAEKLMSSHAQPVQLEGQEVTVTLSIGIAVYPADGQDFNALSKAADVAMYRAKEEGRDAYRFFTADMQVRSTRTLALESHLRRALEKNELQLVYQPQVSLADGRLIGVEALIRWQHATLGLVSPGEFIPLAESNGLILPIGEWVLRTAVRQAKTWLDQGLGKLVMAVNLSAVQFRHAGLAQLVGQVLAEHSLPPDCLELELTESVAMSDPLGAVVAMDEINAQGVHIAIDDFGTGYSSLSYLKRFKAQKLKIDRSFVQDITSDPDDKAIASAIIGLASSLGLRTIAEGVETPGQLAWLRMQGCDEAQGYLFSQPVSANALVTWAAGQGLIQAPAAHT